MTTAFSSPTAPRLARASTATATSAARLLDFHEAYAHIPPAQERPLRQLYRQEVWLMLRRCLRLGWYLSTQRKSAPAAARPAGGAQDG